MAPFPKMSFLYFLKQGKSMQFFSGKVNSWVDLLLGAIELVWLM